MPSSVHPSNSNKGSSANSAKPANTRCPKLSEAFLSAFVHDNENGDTEENMVNMQGVGDVDISASPAHLFDPGFGMVDSLTLVDCNRLELELLDDQEKGGIDEFDAQFEHGTDENTVAKLTTQMSKGLFGLRNRSGMRRGDQDSVTLIVPTKTA